MPVFEQDNDIRIGRERITIVGLPVVKSFYPSSWIKKQYILDFTNLGGGGNTYTAGSGISIVGNVISADDNSSVNELPQINSGNIAPTGSKQGDIWHDTSAPSATKPTILTKMWNGASWIPFTGKSDLSLSVSGNQLQANLNGQTSNTLILPSGNNIYTADGTIAANRTVNVPNNTQLRFLAQSGADILLESVVQGLSSKGIRIKPTSESGVEIPLFTIPFLISDTLHNVVRRVHVAISKAWRADAAVWETGNMWFGNKSEKVVSTSATCFVQSATPSTQFTNFQCGELRFSTPNGMKIHKVIARCSSGIYADNYFDAVRIHHDAANGGTAYAIIMGFDPTSSPNTSFNCLLYYTD